MLGLQQMLSDGRSFPRSNADVCATDRQPRRRYSAADRTTRQSELYFERDKIRSLNKIRHNSRFFLLKTVGLVLARNNNTEDQKS